MFGHIRRHQKWLMMIFAAVVIVSMVQFLDPTTGRGRSIFSRGAGDYGSINGRTLSKEEFSQMKREARLRFFVNYGRWPEEDESSRQMFDADRQTMELIFLVEKVDKLNIKVSDDAVTDWIANAFLARTSADFRVETYQKFLRMQVRP